MNSLVTANPEEHNRQIISTAINSYDEVIDNENDLMLMVSNIIRKLGVPANIKGYSYLREAIMYRMQDPDNEIAVTKVLYPCIAKKFNTSAKLVERSIRHAIEVAWNRGDAECRASVFCLTVNFSGRRPTNSELIATIVDRLKLIN